jgi:hypothetical protein
MDPASRPPNIMAGAKVQAIVPQDFESAWRIANAIVKAGMAPRGLDTPERAMVAILHGLEVGLTPMAALQSIAVVNGRPTIYGDGALGLVRASGLLESFDEQIIEDSQDIVAICRIKRRGEPMIERRFSRRDAEAAHLWDKRGRDGQETPWQTYPRRMLAMRARAFALRDGFADVLRGLGIREEVEDIPADDAPRAPARVVRPSAGGASKALPPVVGEPARAEADGAAGDGSSDVPAAPAALAASAAPIAPAPSLAASDPGDIPPPLRRAGKEPPAEDAASWLNDLDGAFAGCEDAASLWEVQASVMMPMRGKVTAAQWKSAEALMITHFRRISEGTANE